MKDFATALALVLVIEGVVYALFPERMRLLAVAMAQLPAARLRVTGLCAASLGVVAVWLIRG